ncbi:hypothetical protein Barb6_03575 [Bacteroidales bacterium Barb6]|nr:hypothetical protein Barb6_03575 [Bacteroidales bacterium Barb6]
MAMRAVLAYALSGTKYGYVTSLPDVPASESTPPNFRRDVRYNANLYTTKLSFESQYESLLTTFTAQPQINNAVVYAIWFTGALIFGIVVAIVY